MQVLSGDIMDMLTKAEQLNYEMLIDDDINMLIVLLKRKIRAQGIRKGVAA
jgi:hypothetical protein